ncbi:MAG: hypothetical protein FWG91_01415 [Lachnospiraceae bacterium]|nr:hypothetical protein [Lachnospiraceae bacterium]
MKKFMLLDIKCDCFDMLIASFAAWLKNEYRFLFTECIGFHFNMEGRTLGDKIMKSKGDIVDIAIRHGIDIKILDINQLGKERFLAYLKVYNPVILEVDGYDCYWRDTFQKIHRSHYILLVKFDIESASLSCIDTFPTKEGVTIKLDFAMQRAKRFIYVSADENEIVKLESKNYLVPSTERYMQKDGIGTFFDHMDLFINSIESQIDLENEIKGISVSDIIYVPLIWNLKNQSWSYAQFQYLLEYINAKELDNMERVIEEIIKSWEIVIGIIAMKIIRKEKIMNAEKMKGYLRKAVNDEKHFADLLSAYVNNGIMQ